MESKIPFTSYDFWAYLSAGFLLLFAVDYIAGTGLLARSSWTAVQGVVAVSAAYAVGQLVASASAVMFERLLVGRLLGYPRDVLFGHAKAWQWVRALMPGYFHALPDETRQAVLANAKPANVDKAGEALFWVAYAHARTVPAVMARLDNFLNLYGFARNTALVAFIDSALLCWSYHWHDGTPEALYLSWAALVMGLGMTLRYLKFYRQYALEVFTAFAYSKATAPGVK